MPSTGSTKMVDSSGPSGRGKVVLSVVPTVAETAGSAIVSDCCTALTAAAGQTAHDQDGAETQSQQMLV